MPTLGRSRSAAPPNMESPIMHTNPILHRRCFLRTAGMFAGVFALSGCSARSAQRILCDEPSLRLSRRIVEPFPDTADAALQRLLIGNKRYAAGHPRNQHDSVSRRLEVAGGQNPYAMIFGCVDSRVPPEIVFDAGLGDLFVIRTAGHVIDAAVLGSLEFGVIELHIPLLLVLGHERCGAVTAALDVVEDGAEPEGDIATVVDSIRPAVEQAKEKSGDLLDNSVRVNIEMTVQSLKASPTLADAMSNGTLTITGAYYDLETGVVEVAVP